ncbi:heavy metal sensor histidine kinase [Chitinimonas arctica]|uniref:Sensor protein n=1 Tax=Chitinimonas arctica TaxID=2594795 RepID=A0A516SG93_9NEIS|nr:heavy metal sensor histidine kinase [Chitinimonas arctica]QDQ27048.1 heavy metal sensor histidine kinase [Chitinimonas arctica]
MKWLRGSNSLAVRLIVMLTITSVFVIAGAGLMFYVALEAQLNAADHEEIQGKMNALEQLIQDMPDEIQPYDLIEKLQDITTGHPRLLIAVKGRSGWLVVPELKFQHALEKHGDIPDRKILSLYHENDAWLVRKSAITEGGPKPLDAVYLAINVSDSRLTIKRYRSTAVAISVLAALLCGGIGYLVIRRGLAPLEKLATEAEQLTADQLHTPLAIGKAPDEVRSLVASINLMLARLNQSFSNLEQFSADIAHELRTPINSLLQKTEVILSRPRSIQEYEELHHLNLEEFGKLKNMVGDMLFLARADHGMLVLERAQVDLLHEVRQVAEFFEYIASDKQQDIQIRGAGNLFADRLMVHRALTNLFSNAVKYGLPETTIQVDIRHEAKQLVITVSNACAALSEAELQGLFARFIRGNAPLNRDVDGTGIGLAIVRSIMRVHQGSVDAQHDRNRISINLRFPHHERPDVAG